VTSDLAMIEGNYLRDLLHQPQALEDHTIGSATLKTITRSRSPYEPRPLPARRSYRDGILLSRPSPSQPSVNKPGVHCVDASAVSWFWGMLTAGCFIGMGLLKLFDSRKVLIGFALGALFSLTAALFGPATVSLMAFPAVGFFASIMWPVLVSLALNSVSEYHGPFAGILSTGIMGGAVVPLIIGRIGDHFGLPAGVAFLYVTFGCVFSVGFWARPIIVNATILDRDIPREIATDRSV
jgi:MFS family permease